VYRNNAGCCVIDPEASEGAGGDVRASHALYHSQRGAVLLHLGV
jgi:hypothetical protein